MSSFQNAGRSTLENNEVKRAITKGLYGVDIQELQKKQQVRRLYQEELKKQAQQARRRKAQQKQKQRLYDQQLQRKMEMQRKKQENQKLAEKNKKINQINATNQTNLNNFNDNNNNNQKSKTNQKYSQNLGNSGLKNSQSKEQFNKKTTFPSLSQFNDMDNYGNSAVQYSLSKNIYSLQDQRGVRQQQQYRTKRFKQSLDQKVAQIYRQIQSSKNSLGNSNSVIDDIRRRLKSNSYIIQEYNEMQRSGIKQFQQQYSQFYKIPKRTNNFNNDYSNKNSRMKNLDYDSESRYKSSTKNMKVNNAYEESNGFKQKFKTERVDFTNYENKPGKWGNQKSKNFLGNRQALDYQVNSMLTNIDNILDNHNNRSQN